MRAPFIRAPGPIAPGLRIGLLGGSFNPAHVGHRHISLAAMRALQLDYVWWPVSPGNPLKPEKGMAPFAQRMLSACAIAHHPRIVVSDVEAKLGTRFTVDTLAALKKRFPAVHFVWLMGSDNLVQFPRWRNWQTIMRQVPVAIAPRPGSLVRSLASKPILAFLGARVPADARFARRLPPAWTVIQSSYHSASSTQLRARSFWPL